MKRITFVFIGMITITTIVLLSQKEIKDQTNKIVKVEKSKHYSKGIYD